eukprot:TRINITY_DN62723_c0_g1_i1.p1 TRINITY_DN62723_c0_g1~~TRINITY_DN62723_c0_g1_i1.p1  ORF type:complete len:182 (-),score=25.51 TRINITY_DN62723_c0_g1_i1:36-581(-)
MAVDDALAATTARDTATDVPAAATTHEDPPSCGSFVMAEHPNEDAMIPIGQQGSCDISSQSQDAPTPPATKTSPSQYFGDCHGDVDEVYETETIDEYLMPAASRHMCLASSHQGNPPVGIKRLGTGGSSQFGAPTISAHCFQSLSLIHISEPTRLLSISYAVFCLKKKNNINTQKQYRVKS